MSAAAEASPRTCTATKAFTTSACIGALAGATSKTMVAPVERIRLLLQMARFSPSSNASDAAMAVLRKEGTSGLWRGNGLAVVRAMLSKGILFATQDSAKSSLGSDAVAGGIAGLAASGISYPLDLLRTRLAGSVGVGSLASLTRDTIAKHGVLSLWAGCSATLLGGIFFECASTPLHAIRPTFARGPSCRCHMRHFGYCTAIPVARVPWPA